jgi:hypothetical protein
MEGPSAKLAWGPDNGWRGLWFASTEESNYQHGILQPPPSFESEDCSGWTFDTLAAPHNALSQDALSTHAARLTTVAPGLLLTPPSSQVGTMDWGNTQRAWGASMNIDLAQPEALDGGLNTASTGLDGGSSSETKELCPMANGGGLDLGAYRGIGFWAKASRAGLTIHVEINDANSDPRAYQCATDPSNAKAVKDNCYNSFAKPISLSDSFERYEIAFSDLRRDPNWGSEATKSLDLGAVYLLSFEVRSPKCIANDQTRCVGSDPEYMSFDFWIDDLYLYK